MRRSLTLSHERLKEYLYYHPGTGDFVSLDTHYAGKRIGGKRSKHPRILIDGCTYSAARVAWFYVHQAWPKYEIGFRDGDSTNTELANLFDGVRTKHGSAQWRNETPTYRAWKEMRIRCTNPNNNRYHRYGGRGIKVCERWDDFANFLADMGERPHSRLSLDRIDNDGNYEPDNCRWATSKEQGRTNYQLRLLTAFGETLPIGELAAKFRMPRITLRKRLAAGMTVEEALTKPRRSRMVEAFGECLSVSEWARRLGIRPSIICYRLDAGWDVERAVSQRVEKTGEWQRRQIMMERNLVAFKP